MNHRRFFFAIWITMVMYAAGVLIFGDNGLRAQSGLQNEQLRLEANIERLKQINSELTASLIALRDDPNTIHLLAAEMGYAESDVQALRIAGLTTAVRPAFQAGEELSSFLPPLIPKSRLRLLALIAGVAFWVLSWSLKGTIRDHERRND